MIHVGQTLVLLNGKPGSDTSVMRQSQYISWERRYGSRQAVLHRKGKMESFFSYYMLCYTLGSYFCMYEAPSFDLGSCASSSLCIIHLANRSPSTETCSLWVLLQRGLYVYKHPVVLGLTAQMTSNSKLYSLCKIKHDTLHLPPPSLSHLHLSHFSTSLISPPLSPWP